MESWLKQTLVARGGRDEKQMETVGLAEWEKEGGCSGRPIMFGRLETRAMRWRRFCLMLLGWPVWVIERGVEGKAQMLVLVSRDT